ncbi:sigma-70 family RNA polymerase sigma factor [Micromonospora zhanjiangensis]|uniref:RNA polymerase sigma factor n=1 Tax=Micromonospora zhanjiangensis TaxID=1522057 RepID=A0ABV8KTH9_9ACTN
MTLAVEHPVRAGSDRAELDQALRHLHERYAPALLYYLLRLTNGDQHRAEDIVQETLIRAWNHPEARSDGGQWSKPWLFTVARRIAIDHVRAVQSRPPEHPDERIDAYAGRDDAIDRLLDAREVRAALRAMPERLRTVLVAVYFQECSTAEAADLLDVPPGTVKSRTYYALKALREALEARGFTAARGAPVRD